MRRLLRALRCVLCAALECCPRAQRLRNRTARARLWKNRGGAAHIACSARPAAAAGAFARFRARRDESRDETPTRVNADLTGFALFIIIAFVFAFRFSVGFLTSKASTLRPDVGHCHASRTCRVACAVRGRVRVRSCVVRCGVARWL